VLELLSNFAKKLEKTSSHFKFFSSSSQEMIWINVRIRIQIQVLELLSNFAKKVERLTDKDPALDHAFFLCAKKSQYSRNKGFSYCFSLLMEGSGSGSGARSVPRLTDPDLGDPKTYGSGSGTLVLAQMKIDNFTSKRRLWIWYSNPVNMSWNIFSAGPEEGFSDLALALRINVPVIFVEICVRQDKF